MKKILTLIIVIIVSLNLCLGKDIYVSRKRGKNSYPGTKQKPKKSLWKVIKKLKDGDRVFVAEGWYYGKGKRGIMPKCDKSNILIQGGWNSDFTKRDPFKYITIIGPHPKRQGGSGSVFHWEKWNNKISNVIIDGFFIDRGGYNYYYGAGEPGANKKIKGYYDNTCWGYRHLNKKKSGSYPTIQLIGRGSFQVRNMVLINNPWWGIYVKGGGNGKIIIENNLILISQGRAIESVTGGGWGKPTWIIKNNTILFCHAISNSEGRGISIDPRPYYGRYIVENNIIAFCDGSGIAVKFSTESLVLKNNLFFFNRRGDLGKGGTPIASADEFEDELECDNENNEHGIPQCIKYICKDWFARYCIRESVNMLAGDYNTEEKLSQAMKLVGLDGYYIPGYKKKFKTYASLPKNRNNYNMSRYPYPMKKGRAINWKKYVLPLIGKDEERGIQPFNKK